MTTNKSYYVEVLEEVYHAKLRGNPAFSMRSYARFLGIAPQVLSEILRGKRHLPVKYLAQVVDNLALAPSVEALFCESLKGSKTRLKDIAKLTKAKEHLLGEERYFKIISEWEYYAIITLLETNKNYSSAKEIADKLDISVKRTSHMLKVLLDEKLICLNDEGFFKKVVEKLTTSRDVPSRALKLAHKDILSLAIEKIDIVPVENRFYTASTVAINSNRLNDAKELIREFRSKLSHFLSDEKANDVYQFNIQMFPLTNEHLKSTSEKIS